MGLQALIVRGKVSMCRGVDRRFLGGLAMAAMLGLAACSPTHNWREVRHEGAPIQALLPCKPERAEREVPLLGPDQPLARLYMMSCDVQGRTYVLAALAVPAAQSSDDALGRWRQAAWASLRQTVPPQASAPTGWTRQPPLPQAPAAQHWRGPAVDHRGQALQAEILWLAEPGWLAQAAVYAPQIDAEVRQTFFESVRISP